MLDRLHMTVDECISRYLELSSQAFQLKRSKTNVFGRVIGKLKGEGAYQADNLAAAFKNTALLLEGDENARLLYTDSSCKV